MKEYKNKPFRDLEMETRQRNIKQPYFQGSIQMINASTNKTNGNQSNHNQMKLIRIFSASNSQQKNKQYESQKKLKIYKDMNIPTHYQTIQGRPTSVKQSHQNFIYRQKGKGGGGTGYNSELNYPNLTINSTNSQANNLPLQRRRKIIYEEDNDLAEEYEKLRKIWKDVGVTDVYIDNFETVTNNQDNNK